MSFDSPRAFFFRIEDAVEVVQVIGVKEGTGRGLGSVSPKRESGVPGRHNWDLPKNMSVHGQASRRREARAFVRESVCPLSLVLQSCPVYSSSRGEADRGRLFQDDETPDFWSSIWEGSVRPGGLCRRRKDENHYDTHWNKICSCGVETGDSGSIVLSLGR